jgi:hypothetical protein
MAPIYIQYMSEKNSKYSIIFKKGDDLRQDQLITQVKIDICYKLIQFTFSNICLHSSIDDINYGSIIAGRWDRPSANTIQDTRHVQR